MCIRDSRLPPKPPHTGNNHTPSTAPPPRIDVPMLMRPWVLHACHATTSYQLGVSRTVSMLARLFWWIGMDISTRWWIRRCLKYQAHTTSRKPIAGLSSPYLYLTAQASPSASTTSAQYPLNHAATHTSSCPFHPPYRHVPRDGSPVHRRRHRRHPRRPVHSSLGCLVTLISDNGLKFTSRPSYAFYERVGINKINTTSYHPRTNGGVERVNHTMAIMLSMGVNVMQDNRDALLKHCLLYTSPSPRDRTRSRMPSSA